MGFNNKEAATHYSPTVLTMTFYDMDTSADLNLFPAVGAGSCAEDTV